MAANSVPGIRLALYAARGARKEEIMKLGLAAIATLAIGAAHAQPSDKFRSLDRNSDGFLSKEELGHIQGYERAFDEADDNRDARLSPDEFVKSESIHDRQTIGKAIDD